MDQDVNRYLYPDQDSDWEYKTMRARWGEFGDRRQLAEMLRQEAVAGWQMVEKHSDNQVRLCRPRSARLLDAQLPPDIDPYRTNYRPSRPVAIPQVVFLVLCVLVVLLLIVALALIGAWMG